MNKRGWIVQAFTLSVALNLLLLCVFFYFLVRKNPIFFSYRPYTARQQNPTLAPPAKVKFLRVLKEIKYDTLITLLSDERTIGHGYRVRDFALGALATYHDFDVERALHTTNQSVRSWEFEGKKFLLFPGLLSADFEKLKHFAHHEKYPFSIKGLFKRIAALSEQERDPEMIQLFCHAPQFILLETLFARTQQPILKKRILSLALEGGWEVFEAYYNQQQERVDFSPEKRRSYLLATLKNNSPTAATLLLLTDADFTINELNDYAMVKLLELLPKQSPRACQFARHIAVSPRGDAVRLQAKKFLTGSL